MSVEYVKHLAIAVSNVDEALAQYQKFLGIGMDSKPRDLAKAGSREAHFVMGNVEIQLCQSLTDDHRFSTFIKEHGEGLHHACLAVRRLRVGRDGPFRRRHPERVQILPDHRRA